MARFTLVYGGRGVFVSKQHAAAFKRISHPTRQGFVEILRGEVVEYDGELHPSTWRALTPPEPPPEPPTEPEPTPEPPPVKRRRGRPRRKA